MSWHKDAPCRVENTDDLSFNRFFEQYGKDPDPDYEAVEDSRDEVDSLCGGCPFKEECLEEALAFSYNKLGKPSTGVFGGMYLTLGYYDNARNNHKPIVQRRQEEAKVKRIRKELREEYGR